MLFRALKQLLSGDQNQLAAQLDDTEYDKELRESQIELLAAAAGTQNAVESILCTIKEDLSAERRKMHYLADILQDALLIVDTDGNIELFNPAAEKMFGYKSKDVIWKNINMLMPERFQDIHPKVMARYSEKKDSMGLRHPREVIGLRHDGEEFPIEITISMFETSENKIMFLALMRDITERRKLTIEIIKKDKTIKMLSAAIEESHDAVCICDKEFNVLHMNNNFVNLYGSDEEELIGNKPPFINSTPGSREIQRIIRNGELWTGIIEVDHKDRSSDTIKMQITPIMNGLPIPKFYIIIHKKLSE